MLISILFFILIFFFVIIIGIGSTLLRGLSNILFGRRSWQRSYTTQENSTQSSNSNDDTRQKTRHQPTSKKREKIFDASEGEYVDFEEIKD